KNLLELDIALIRAIRFAWNIKDLQNQVFITSLYKIDYILEERALDLEFIDKQLIKRDLLDKHYIYIDIFLKIASD
ncbi:hypothetical protein OIDMADRAFT_131980, partial [Oidiodendron maius Zn]